MQKSFGVKKYQKLDEIIAIERLSTLNENSMNNHNCVRYKDQEVEDTGWQHVQKVSNVSLPVAAK